VWVHNDICLKALKIEQKLFGNKKHGLKWTDQDAIARAIKEGKPQGRFGSADDLDFLMGSARELATQRGGSLSKGVQEELALPFGTTSRVFFPDGTSRPATHVWWKIYDSGKIHAYPILGD
jgi:hypothetical protein